MFQSFKEKLTPLSLNKVLEKICKNSALKQKLIWEGIDNIKITRDQKFGCLFACLILHRQPLNLSKGTIIEKAGPKEYLRAVRTGLDKNCLKTDIVDEKHLYENLWDYVFWYLEDTDFGSNQCRMFVYKTILDNSIPTPGNTPETTPRPPSTVPSTSNSTRFSPDVTPPRINEDQFFGLNQDWENEIPENERHFLNCNEILELNSIIMVELNKFKKGHNDFDIGLIAKLLCDFFKKYCICSDGSCNHLALKVDIIKEVLADGTNKSIMLKAILKRFHLLFGRRKTL